jgi:hypothetical protein
VIAVEEHCVKDHYWSKTENLTIPSGEEPERQFMLNFPRRPQLRPRFAKIQTRLAEIDAAGIDVSVLSLVSFRDLPGVPIRDHNPCRFLSAPLGAGSGGAHRYAQNCDCRSRACEEGCAWAERGREEGCDRCSC